MPRLAHPLGDTIAAMIRARSFWASLAVAAILSAPAAAAEWAIDGRVIGVSDGDTVTLLDHAKAQHKIRLHGIDAPEKGQAFGERSKQNLSGLAFHRDVTAQCHKRDRYGREVCKIMLGSTDVNLEQLRAGMAWWYREYAKEQPAEDQAAYSAAERDAHARRAGLWNDAVPVPPWEWRKNEKAMKASFSSR
jgi:endonuclease YncB( thermonuclease family)